MFSPSINKVTCLGAGYVGGPTMCVLSKYHPNIKFVCADLNKDRINKWNSEKLTDLPVFEKGLPEIVKDTRNKNLFFTANVIEAIKESDVIFVAVNTPTKNYGQGKGMASDLRFIESCATLIGKNITGDTIIVEKSTVPVKTSNIIKEIVGHYNKKHKVTVLSSPEFLAEGTAIEDLENPDRILIGHDKDKFSLHGANVIKNLFLAWVDEKKILKTNVWSSEISKLVSNAFLAQRVSSVNSISALCERTGADIDEVSKAVGLDSRIGSKFLNASVGFGGSCFQKDILNLVYLCKYYGLNDVANYWESVIKMNEYQRSRFAELVIKELNNTVADKKLSLLGWAFKKDTNDSRESASIYIANILLHERATLSIYDPKVSREQILDDIFDVQINSRVTHNFGIKLTREEIESSIKVEKTLEDCLNQSDSALILTEWDDFKNAEWKELIDTMKPSAKIFDGRRIIPKKIVSENKNIFSIGSQ